MKIVKTRWIDINKGDLENTIIRCRLVGKEFNNGELEGLFAGTPPLEALRLLLSDVATNDHSKQIEKRRRKLLMINDVSRAFFEAPMQRDLCIELPDEDLSEVDKRKDMVGYLNQSLYGTRDAAANFQKEVKKFMESIGFSTGRYNPCTYYPSTKKLKTLVHGDDFATSGSRENCMWMRQQLERRFEIKTKVIGLGDEEVREERILNRIIRVTHEGWEMEADQRHADIIIERLNLKEAKGVSSPCEEEKRWEDDENREALTDQEGRKYRELAARANYLAQDRCDIQYAVKELCRGMCTPTKGDVKKLRRLGRYLITTPRTVVRYNWQSEQDSLYSFSDSDFAGCRRTAKSTSGGVVMLGTHYIKSWSSTQKTIALSSGEAELTAVVKCSCETIGILQLSADWFMEIEGEALVDSSAALGVDGR